MGSAELYHVVLIGQPEQRTAPRDGSNSDLLSLPCLHLSFNLLKLLAAGLRSTFLSKTHFYRPVLLP